MVAATQARSLSYFADSQKKKRKAVTEAFGKTAYPTAQPESIYDEAFVLDGPGLRVSMIRSGTPADSPSEPDRWVFDVVVKPICRVDAS